MSQHQPGSQIILSLECLPHPFCPLASYSVVLVLPSGKFRINLLPLCMPAFQIVEISLYDSLPYPTLPGHTFFLVPNNSCRWWSEFHSIWGPPHLASCLLVIVLGFPGGSCSKQSACDEGDPGSSSGSGRASGGGNGNPLQYSCLEKSHGQKSLAGYGPLNCKASDTTEQLTRSLPLS